MKKFTLILAVCLFNFILIIGSAVAEEGDFPKEESIKSAVAEADDFFEEESKNTNDYNQYTENIKDSLYYDYIINVLESAVENSDEILDCKIDINFSGQKPAAADVKITAKDGGIGALQTDIKDYLSQSLNISYENIVLIFD